MLGLPIEHGWHPTRTDSCSTNSAADLQAAASAADPLNLDAWMTAGLDARILSILWYILKDLITIMPNGLGGLDSINFDAFWLISNVF